MTIRQNVWNKLPSVKDGIEELVMVKEGAMNVVIITMVIHMFFFSSQPCKAKNKMTLLFGRITWTELRAVVGYAGHDGN